ncbi:MAG TPA: helix-turn-helix transcriptional regulator [Savagea sp.]
MEEWNNEKFGERLRTLRLSRQLSMMAFGEAIGTSASRIKDWEQGNNAPSITWLAKIAARFNVTTDALILGTEPLQLQPSNDELFIEYEKMRERLHEQLLARPKEYDEQMESYERTKQLYRGQRGRRQLEYELVKLIAQLPNRDIYELYELTKVKASYQLKK